MASVTDICNLALSHIGRPYIMTIDDSPREAKECKRLYPIIRDAVLSAFPWGFATKQAALAELDETPYGNWAYAYAVPTDCLAVRKLFNIADDGLEIEFDVVANPALNGRMLLTNESGAELIYTAKVTDTNLFDHIFVDALSYRMAADLAVPLTGSAQLQAAAYNMFMRILGQAQQKVGREQYRRATDDSDLSRSRG